MHPDTAHNVDRPDIGGCPHNAYTVFRGTLVVALTFGSPLRTHAQLQFPNSQHHRRIRQDAQLRLPFPPLATE